ncbi:MAG: AmmeMemoRadiSam system radical SAM enzyme [Campylobacterota bacterium]|nr:AmmeMemoRadiSam system radical SAM enzyme [Campylobacterota bacterium]
MHYFKKENEKLTCLLCSHYCKLKPNQTGICGVNKNTGSKIECLVFGYPAALNIDPIEKKPLYHVLPNTTTLSLGTVGCNFKCPFCQNHGISQEHNIDKNKHQTPEQLVQLAVSNGCQSISYTYNEPTIFYPYAKATALIAQQYGLKNIFVSNGFESKEVIDDMVGVIDAANIDLKSFDKHYYKKELGGNLDSILDNLKRFKTNGIHVEITTLIIPTKNDSDEELILMAQFIANELGVDTPWHLSAFHPDYKQQDLPRTSVDTLNRAYAIGKKAGLNFVYQGNASLPNPTCCTQCGYEILNRVTYAIEKNDLVQGNLCPKCSTPLPGVFMNTRNTSVAGTFYPDSCSEIKRYINHFNTALQNSDFNHQLDFSPKAIICPHAGYVYSGFTANIAYCIIQHIQAKRFVVIGPSHKIAFEGLSVSTQDSYQSPCGNINIDTQYANTLIEKFNFCHFNAQAHTEHSTETQMPFIQHYFPNSSIVEIVYSRSSSMNIEQIIEYALHDKDTFVIISTDLSHFHTLNEANILDNYCLEAIENLDLDSWNKGCEACGQTGVKALISYAQKHQLQSKLLDYRTSAQMTKDESSVVGYTSAVLG